MPGARQTAPTFPRALWLVRDQAGHFLLAVADFRALSSETARQPGNSLVLRSEIDTQSPDGGGGQILTLACDLANRSAGQERRSSEAATLGFVVDRLEKPGVQRNVGLHRPRLIED